jgi:hypothetical protein
MALTHRTTHRTTSAAAPVSTGRATPRSRRSRRSAGVGLALTLATGALGTGALSLPSPAPAACALGSNFGRMFPSAPAATWSDAELTALSEAVTEVTHLEPEKKGADDEMRNIAAGYTYAGQFLDHDIVLDPMPLSLDSVNLSTLRNLRTPQLDLDSVYGAGPWGSPHLFEDDGVHFRVGEQLYGAASDPGARDLPRDENGRALVGDPRNDENRIVASLHSIVTRYHNKVADELLASGMPEDQVYEAAKKQTTWHYQWALLADDVRQGPDRGRHHTRRWRLEGQAAQLQRLPEHADRVLRCAVPLRPLHGA